MNGLLQKHVRLDPLSKLPEYQANFEGMETRDVFFRDLCGRQGTQTDFAYCEILHIYIYELRLTRSVVCWLDYILTSNYSILFGFHN